jgi:acetate kinase
MKTLVINTGSSSLKFQLFEVDAGSDGTPATRTLARGKVDSIGKEASCNFIINGKAPVDEKRPVKDHEQAVKQTLDWLKEVKCDFNAVGHRIVHGGDRFIRPAFIDPEVIRAIESLSELAPLHNPIGLAGIRACREALGNEILMVAVFDTAFHSTMPPAAFNYAIPNDLAVRHKIRRYGFHGIAHSHLVSRYSQIAKTEGKDTRLITLHLGQGCSATAVRAGRSIDTSMGFTPLEGLVMGTRSGDIDPAIVGYIAEKENAEASKIVEWLNRRSGLAGLSGKTDDMRELLKMEAHDPRARLAIDVFCQRVKKYIGSYLAVLEGADAIIFSGGIGENQAEIRERICRGMEWCGLIFDPERNRSSDSKESRISAEAATCHAYVIPADEESVIAKETYLCLHQKS